MATRYPQNRRCRAGHYDSNVTAENLRPPAISTDLVVSILSILHPINPIKHKNRVELKDE